MERTYIRSTFTVGLIFMVAAFFVALAAAFKWTTRTDINLTDLSLALALLAFCLGI